MEPVRLTRQEIKKLVDGIRSLDHRQKPVVREMLERLSHSSDGRVSEEELRRELSRLRKEHAISDLDADAVLSAVFE